MSDITLTHDQNIAFRKIKSFIENRNEKVFILKGYAGTGKTTLVTEILEYLTEQEVVCQLLASTGRAAKILANVTHNKATTIHGALYQFRDFNKDLEEVTHAIETTKVDSTGQLYLLFDLVPVENDGNQRLYIVDEASMISDSNESDITQAFFGTGKLLSDLINYDSNGKFIFVGDDCQLPPVNQKLSPALSQEYICEHFHCRVNVQELTNIVRQKATNDIIVAANQVRCEILEAPLQPCLLPNGKPLWKFLYWRGSNNIVLHCNQDDLINSYIDCVKKYGYNYSTLITHSNKQCEILSKKVRNRLGLIGGLQPRDLLLVTQNNIPTGLMNGDLVEVLQVGTRTQRADLTFVHVEVKELFTQRTCSLYLIEDILHSGLPNLAQSEQKLLFIDYYYRMKEQGVSQRSSYFKENMQHDPYLNALRAVYGYALTCHKAQGGEWNEVYLDIRRNITASPTKDSYRWLYTAMTRAQNMLHVADDFFIK